jgi:predicted phosphodiesterase
MKHLLISLFALLSFTQPVSADIGLISDLHVGSEKARKNSEGSYVYPKKALGEFKKTLKIMNGKVDFILVLGDSTNKKSSKYAKQVKKASAISKVPVLFVKGNHDKDGFRYISKETYYTREINGVKIMVLDTNYTDLSSIGQISDVQRQWIYDNIEGVDVIGMHHPINQDARSMQRYAWLDELVKEHNITVYSGHIHRNQTEGNYHWIGALTTSGYVIDNF